MKYIFVAGAPGSKWSSVAKNIYHSASIDRSDNNDQRVYCPDSSKPNDAQHVGAYFDPGMEYELPEHLTGLSKRQAEDIFDSPFHQSGVRIIKSHIFSYKHNIDFLRNNWPECPIVLVQRSNDACLGWWVKAGHFDITYPNYKHYYKDFKTMAGLIELQNKGITEALAQYVHKQPKTNKELSKILGIIESLDFQDYTASDIDVYVI